MCVVAVHAVSEVDANSIIERKGRACGSGGRWGGWTQTKTISYQIFFIVFAAPGP